MNVMVDESTGRVVIELQGLGERLLLLSGDRASGYHLQVPRQGLDQTSPSMGDLPLPFLPNVGSAEGLAGLLTEGKLAGVEVTKRDALGPVKLHFRGTSDQGQEVEVWLKRVLWE